MKRLLTILCIPAVLLLLSSTEGWSLPACEGSNVSTWTNCFGGIAIPDEGKYVGEFKNGKKHGHGTNTWPDGEKYVGEFKDGEYHGQGTGPVPAPDAARTIPKVAADISQLPRKSPTPPIIESMLEINPRFYIGASGGMSTFDTGISNTTGTAKLDEDDSGFKFYGGVNLNRIFGLEAHYADLGQVSLSGNPGDRFDAEGKTLQFTKSATITTEEASYGLAATAGYDVTRWFRPFAKFGVHRWDYESTAVSSTTNASASDDGIDIFFGAGVQSRIYEGLSVRAEFERFNLDDDEEVDFFSAGVNYQF